MGYAAALQSRHSDPGGLQHIPAPTMPSGHLQKAALIFSFGQVEQRNLFPQASHFDIQNTACYGLPLRPHRLNLLFYSPTRYSLQRFKSNLIF